MGNRNGKEGDEDPFMDQGRRADAEDALSREDKDQRDRPEAEAELCRDAAKGIVTWCDAGGAEEKANMREKL